MVYFKAENGALIPFTQPLMAAQRLTHGGYNLSISVGNSVIWEKKLNPGTDHEARHTLKFMLGCIHDAVEESATNTVLNLKDWGEAYVARRS